MGIMTTVIVIMAKRDYGDSDYGKLDYGDHDYRKQNYGNRDDGERDNGNRDDEKRGNGNRDYGKRNYWTLDPLLFSASAASNRGGRLQCRLVVAFSSRKRILGECSTIHSPPALYFLIFFMEISSRTLIPLFRPGLVHSGSAS